VAPSTVTIVAPEGSIGGHSVSQSHGAHRKQAQDGRGSGPGQIRPWRTFDISWHKTTLTKEPGGQIRSLRFLEKFCAM
jgi:hypothetical protein